MILLIVLHFCFCFFYFWNQLFNPFFLFFCHSGLLFGLFFLFLVDSILYYLHFQWLKMTEIEFWLKIWFVLYMHFERTALVNQPASWKQWFLLYYLLKSCKYGFILRATKWISECNFWNVFKWNYYVKLFRPNEWDVAVFFIMCKTTKIDICRFFFQLTAPFALQPSISQSTDLIPSINFLFSRKHWIKEKKGQRCVISFIVLFPFT